MKKHLAALVISVTLVLNPVSFAVKDFVAHAGGSVYGISYTNSLEALNHSYEKGFRIMEVDLMRTTDGQLVLAHDYNWAVPLFIDKVGPLSYSQFMNSKTVYGLTLLDLPGLVEWMVVHPDTEVMLDKLDLKGYRYIAANYPELLSRFIPQAFKIEDVQTIRSMGYSKVLLTLYQVNYTEKQIVEFMNRPDLYGMTISYDTFKNSKLIQKNCTKTRIYVHTINEIGHYFLVHNAGARGVITDYLEPIALEPTEYASRVSSAMDRNGGSPPVDEIKWASSFFTVHDAYKKYNGSSFKVLSKLEGGPVPQYSIVLDGGETITAYQSEIDGVYRTLEELSRK